MLFISGVSQPAGGVKTPVRLFLSNKTVHWNPSRPKWSPSVRATVGVYALNGSNFVYIYRPQRHVLTIAELTLKCIAIQAAKDDPPVNVPQWMHTRAVSPTAYTSIGPNITCLLLQTSSLHFQQTESKSEMDFDLAGASCSSRQGSGLSTG